MKKLVLFIAAIATLAQANAQSKVLGKPKLSPFTQQYLQKAQHGNGKPMAGYVYKNTAQGMFLSAIIKVSDNGAQAAIEALGAHIGTKAGNIWTVQVPLAKVAEFTRITGISYIDIDVPAFPALDSARRVTHTDSVHRGINLPMPYTGKDVVVGVVDVGFDYTHPTFFDTTGTLYRIKKVWEEKSLGTPPAGFSYGSEITDSTGMWGAGTDHTIYSHGSHVTGIAAGSGFGGDTTGRRLRGMAYQSDIVLVGILPDHTQWFNTGLTDMVDGINYIYQYAAGVGKPAVVNLSWGTTTGPHDGTSLFSQAVDNLTGAGKIFVCAAGNNGQDSLHLQKTFTATDTTVSTIMNFSPYLAEKRTWVDVWGKIGKTFCMQISLYGNGGMIDSTGFVCLDDTTHNLYIIGSNGDTCFVNMTTSSAEFNLEPRIFFDMYSKVPDSVVITLKGTDGTVNMWQGYVQDAEGYYGSFTSAGMPWAVKGDNNFTISDIATTNSAITVGAFNSKVNFKNLDGDVLYYTGFIRGKLALFSSIGPTADYRIKPDIAAPGLAVASSVNSFDTSFSLTTGTNYNSNIRTYHKASNNRDYYYAMLAGTSMASPCTAGIVALMLQANPALTPQGTKEIIFATAIHDTYTGAATDTGNSVWGHGKINAYRAVLAAVATTSVTNTGGSHAPECMLYPNPGNGTFSIDYISDKAGSMRVEVLDMQGKLQYADNWSVGKGYNTKKLVLSKLPKGIYFTKISYAEGFTVIKTSIL